METNVQHYSLLLLFFLSIVTVELYAPQGAAARKLLLDNPGTDDGGQHKIGASGSTSHHAGSATGDNDTLPGVVRLSPPTALTYIVHLKNGSTMTVSVPFPNINYSFVPPGIPIPAVTVPNIRIPHVRPPPPPALGFAGYVPSRGQYSPIPGRGQYSPIPWLHWP